MNINCLSKTQRLFKSSGDNKTTTSLMFYGKCFMFYGWCFMGKKSPSNMQLQSYSLSVQFSRSVVSDSLRPHGLQHTRPPCASPTSGVYPNSCPLSWWYHPTIFILWHPLLLLPSIFPSIRVFSNESTLRIRWPKYWSFSFKHQSFQWTLRTDLL